MKKLTSYQIYVLETLFENGKVFYFDDGTVGLDDQFGNTEPFNKKSFNILFESKLIEVKERPSLGVEVYGLTDMAFKLINETLITQIRTKK